MPPSRESLVSSRTPGFFGRAVAPIRVWRVGSKRRGSGSCFCVVWEWGGVTGVRWRIRLQTMCHFGGLATPLNGTKSSFCNRMPRRGRAAVPPRANVSGRHVRRDV